ncbi:peptidase M16 [Roseovarius sp. 22II1-1F6A]|nr:peptidase M16 [Roseovarius sp. 22II1-1F6A]
MTIRQDTLANGLTVVTEHMPSMGSATIGVWVSAGGRHERAEQNGIAHFLEHMAFKGTARRSPLQIAEEIENVGGYINAYTSREQTAYYARVLEADVPLALDVIADIVLNPVFDAREIEVERGVILSEIGQSNDTPDDIIFDWLQEVAYPDQAFGRTILGPAERIKSFSRADLSGFVAERYAPGKMVLSAAGAVDHDAILRLAEDLFGHLPAHPGLATEAARFSGGERREVKQLEQVHFTLAFEGPGYSDPGFRTAQIYAGLMGGGMSSRLFQEAREKRGLCYTIFAQAGSYTDTGMMTIYAGTSAADIGGLVDLTLDELRRVTSDLGEEELARARAQMKAGLLMGLESPSARAERMARYISVFGRVPDLTQSLAQIDAVTRQDVMRFAEGLVAQGRPAMALYGPAGDAPDLARMQDRLAA